MASGDRIIKWKVQAGVVQASLEATMDALSVQGWTITNVVHDGTNYTVIGWQWQTVP